MAAISGIVYLIIGAGITYLSRYIRKDGLNLELFYWIGILFITIGVFKIIFRFITKRPKKKAKIKELPALEPLHIEKEITPTQTKKPKPEIDYSKYPKYCPKCRFLYSQNSNFCSKCGSQLYIKP